MLKTRIITAVILAGIFLLALFFLSDAGFSVFLALVLIGVAWEWAGISALKDKRYKIAYVFVLLVCMLILQPLISIPDVFKILVLLAMLWWLVVVLVLYLVPVAEQSAAGFSWFFLAAGVPTIIPALLSAQYLRSGENGSPWLLLYALAIVWAMDIGAYFSGKRWGKHKLAPLISPGKTIEGVAGGVVFVLLLCSFALIIRTHEYPESITLFLATVIAGLWSISGDLFESRGKRLSGLKDSGQLLPGHGGVLDRLDSTFAALPLFTFALLWF